MLLQSTGCVLTRPENAIITMKTSGEIFGEKEKIPSDQEIISIIYSLIAKGICLDFIEHFIDETPCQNTRCKKHLFYEGLHWERHENELTREMLNCGYGVTLVGALTLEEIGSFYGMSREWMRQIETKALFHQSQKIAINKELRGLFNAQEWAYRDENIKKKYEHMKRMGS